LRAAVAPSGNPASSTQMQMHLNMHNLRGPSCVLCVRAAGDACVTSVAYYERLRPPLVVAQGTGPGAGRAVPDCGAR
jgi:hypothetical protein